MKTSKKGVAVTVSYFVDSNCPMVNMCKSVLGQTKVKQVKQSQKHVENMIKT